MYDRLLDPEPSLAPAAQRPRRTRLLVVAIAGVAAIVVVGGIVSRVVAEQKLTTLNAALAVPTVKLAKLASGDADSGLLLPAQLQAFDAAPIHARVSGYLRRWYVDIGTPVKQGQLLADIDSPDLDQQLVQAKADLATAVANQNLSRITADRWAGLVAQDAVSKQDWDNKQGDLEAKKALTNAAGAAVKRLEALESFKRLVAPFDGLVTARNADIGQLIAAGTPVTTPLFMVSDERRLRIFVQLPQSYISEVQPGTTATLTVPEHPQLTFKASVVKTANAVDPASGSQQTELWIDNADGALKPGDYAQVRFQLPAAAGVVRVPASAVIARDSGLSLAIVGPGGRVSLRPIQVARDLGAYVEVTSGVSMADRVIDDPLDVLQNGDVVRIASASGAAARSTGHG
jgi:RND family efflux transporter MFP subunit